MHWGWSCELYVDYSWKTTCISNARDYNNYYDQECPRYQYKMWYLTFGDTGTIQCIIKESRRWDKKHNETGEKDNSIEQWPAYTFFCELCLVLT